MNIGIDVDGVLTDYEWYMDFFASKMGSRGHINADESNMLIRYSWTREQEKKFHRKYFFWYVRKMPIRENVAATISALRTEGNKIYIITARAYADKKTLFGGLMRVCLKHWLNTNLVEYDELIFVDWKNSAEEKAEWAKRLKVDFFLEDNVENIKKLQNICEVICIRAGYNKNLYDVTYANDFYEVYTLLGAKQCCIEKNCVDVEKLNEYYKSFPWDEKVFKKYQKQYRMIRNTIGKFIELGMHLEVSGRENIPEENGVVFVCNHRSSMDIPIAYLALGEKYVRVLTKKEYELSKLGVIQRALGTIFVNRNSKHSSRTAQMIMAETLLHDGNVLIFPEGTRNKTNQILLPFRYGATRIAKKTGRPIVPIVIKKEGRNSFRVLIGNRILVNGNDELETKNNELWECMRDMLN